MRRYLSINRKGLCPKSCQLNSGLPPLCLCFNLGHSALSCGLKSPQEDAGPPLEMVLTFSFFLRGFSWGKRSRVSFLGSWVPALVKEVTQVALCWLLPAGLCPARACPAQALPSTALPVTHWPFLTSLEPISILQGTKFCNQQQSSKELFRKEVLGELQWPVRFMWIWNSSLGWPQIRFVFSQDLGHFTQSWPLGFNIAEQGYTTWFKCVAIKCLLMSNRNYPGYAKLLPWKDINVVQQVVWVWGFLPLHLFIIFQS